MGARVQEYPSAAVLTVGTELVLGLRPDTNAAEVGRALTVAGYDVREEVSVPDDLPAVTEAVARLSGTYDLLVITGGLGPTHDDVTREAASSALGCPLVRDDALLARLEAVAASHSSPYAAEQVYRQAYVLEGAHVIAPGVGTAPGEVVTTARGKVVLLPGPPAEMRPMLDHVLADGVAGRASPIVLSCACVTESDLQVAALDALADAPGVGLTVLARPAEVDVVLLDNGAGADRLGAAATAVRDALGDVCFASDGSSLQETVVHMLRERCLTLAVAESCTGGGLAAAITDVPGASDVFLGGAVAYADAAKVTLLGVEEDTLRRRGAVSRETAAAMASGVRERLRADVGLAVTGIAGPGGGSREKPVGLVWFAVSGPFGDSAEQRDLPGDREGVRRRATITALDLLRRCLTSA